MEIRWGHLCVAADFQFPLWSLTGLADSLPVGGPHGPLSLVFALQAHQNEGRPGQVLDLRIVDTTNTTVHELPQSRLQWISLGPAYPMLSYNRADLTAWRPPLPGVYRIVATVDGTPAEGSVEFYGMAAGQRQAPAPPIVREHGFRVEWAHIVANVIPQLGLVSLERIIEFSRARYVGRPPIFNGYYTASITGGTMDGQDHRSYLELHGPDGELLRRFNEGPLHFESAGPGHLWGAFLGLQLNAVEFPLGVGEYAFELYVDGERAGTLDYWFVEASGITGQ